MERIARTSRKVTGERAEEAAKETRNLKKRTTSAVCGFKAVFCRFPIA
jgi:hypothetical protein